MAGDVNKAACDLTSLSLSLFLLESIDQLDGGEEAGTLLVVFDGLHAKCVAMCVLPVPGPPPSTKCLLPVDDGAAAVPCSVGPLCPDEGSAYASDAVTACHDSDNNSRQERGLANKARRKGCPPCALLSKN